MSIRDLFVHDLTRDIPPVVYFHDVDPNKVRSEVDEYIVTGGYPQRHSGRNLVPDGIHEQYVRLLNGLVAELTSPTGATSPGCWVSGFFGSGKSSFAKLLGLALDDFRLPGDERLADRWLGRDLTPLAGELHQAWRTLHETLRHPPLAVVFDVGAVARDGEHVHSAVVRQVQVRLGYARDEVVAREEIRLERDGLYERFLGLAQEAHGRPWPELAQQARVGRHFSVVMHRLDPVAYTQPLEWLERNTGGVGRAQSAEEAVEDIAHMLAAREPDRTLFVVVDEVSQYILPVDERITKLQAFVELLGARLRGRVWLVALGQQKLEEAAAGGTNLPKLKDRFPKRLRVHLDPANIRDVVHQRLLRKKPGREDELRRLFQANRAALEAHALGGANLSEDDFVATYPLLPSYVDLLLRITSALRRSSRAQADDHEIRGLLQLLGEVFRTRGHADQPLGVLVAIDDVFEVQRTALDAEMQQSLARVLNQCADDPLHLRVCKAVALLQLLQDDDTAGGTDAALVTKALFDRVDAGDRTEAVTTALETLRRRNLLGYSERAGYKIQSSAAEEWERERRDVDVPADQLSELVRRELAELVRSPDEPRFKGQKFSVGARYSDDVSAQDVFLVDPRDPAALLFDLRFVRDTTEATWIRRAGEEALRHRVVWVAADLTPVRAAAEELGRSLGMLRKHEPSAKTGALLAGRRRLYHEEEGRRDELQSSLRKELDGCFARGTLYFQGRRFPANDLGASFAQVAVAAGNRFLPELFTEFVATQVAPSELMQLVPNQLQAPSTKFLDGELGLLETERGQYVPSCKGVVPQRVLAVIEADKGLTGTQLLARFGGPPYGWHPGVVKAAVAALLRAGRIRITLEEGNAVTTTRDAGVVDLFEKDRAFRRATLFPAGEDVIGAPTRNKIRKFLESSFGTQLDATNDAIADVVASKFPGVADRLQGVYARLNRLVPRPADPPGLVGLQEAIAACVQVSRYTQATVEQVAKRFDVLKDGFAALDRVEVELTPDAVQGLIRVFQALDVRVAQLAELGALAVEVAAARDRLAEHARAPRPWLDLSTVESDVKGVEVAYQGARAALLSDQQTRCDDAKAEVARRTGFEKLTADEQYEVLSSIDGARASTTDQDALPSLVTVRDTFEAALTRTVTAANQRLDQLLNEREHPVVCVSLRNDLRLINREVGSVEELAALLEGIKAEILPHVTADPKRRVRLT